MKLTENQKKFAEYYSQSGNGSEAYKRAYSTCKKDETAKVNASRLLTNANVIQYVEELNEKIKSERIADMKEVKEMWSKILRSQIEGVEIKDILKASEYIAKTNGAFLDKVEITEKHIVVDIEDDEE